MKAGDLHENSQRMKFIVNYWRNQHRIFYVVMRGKEMYLLHVYLKKTQKAPLKELETAKLRMKLLMEGNK
ncbi:MAG: type II toxin-antitoxin system RelE/ParE family toxin [Nitrospiraceae bacterium]|nr:type II toxin-antitoxin system RelE/ParE family toxin [Nitrospiraceae bacterium]